MRTVSSQMLATSCVAAAMLSSTQALHIPDIISGETRTFNAGLYRNKAAALFLSTIASPNDEEANRFRNRSILLENTLRQKVQALKLSDQKLTVLQDAVKRVMATRTTEHLQEEEEANNNNAADTVAEVQVLEWKARYERAETARLEAVSALSQVQRQYQERKIQIQNERDRLVNEMETLQKTYRIDQKRWEADVETHMKAQKDLAELDRDHQRSLRQQQEARTELKETQKELADYRASVQQIATTAATETEVALQRERERVQTIRAQWAELKVENARLEENHLAHAEAMQIAQASVAAAERREEALQKEVASWNEKYIELLEINKELQTKIQESVIQQQASVEVVDATNDIEDFVLVDPVFEKSPYVADQEILHTGDPSKAHKPSRLKRVASVVFGPARRWRENRAKQQSRRR